MINNGIIISNNGEKSPISGSFSGIARTANGIEESSFLHRVHQKEIESLSVAGINERNVTFLNGKILSFEYFLNKVNCHIISV